MDTNASQMLKSAENARDAHRLRLIEDATAGQLADHLDSVCRDLAVAEGRVYLLTTVAKIMEQEDYDLAERRARAISHVYATMSQGADDEWSGRGNDLRRARFEGITRAASDLRFGVLGVN